MSARPRLVRREHRADYEPHCTAPAPVPAPLPDTTAPLAALSAEPGTGTGNELASQSENSDPVPKGRGDKKFTRLIRQKFVAT